MSTHSPFFVHHVPLRDVRLVRLRGGSTEVAAIPERIISDLPWNEAVEQLAGQAGGAVLEKDVSTGCVAARSWFSAETRRLLAHCYRGDADALQKAEACDRLRGACRILPSADDERKLSFLGRRLRGEIFFARRWILVEGACELMLLHALGRAFGRPLDTHGIAVIDFQLGDGAGIYAALGEGLGIPWSMIVDGDNAGRGHRDSLLKRGFCEDDLRGRVDSLTPPNTLEDQLIADGHELLLRELLVEGGWPSAGECTRDQLRTKLGSHNTAYMHLLALRLVNEPALAERMPAIFVNTVQTLRDA
jgi:putative ATP-dependent endonuclease of OLD family